MLTKPEKPIGEPLQGRGDGRWKSLLFSFEVDSVNKTWEMPMSAK